MKTYLKKLKSKIQSDPLTFYEGGDIPARESLYFHYTECYCMHSDLTKQLSQEINELLSSLPFADGDKVCSLSSELAAEHERIGFVAGLQLGAQLILELGKEDAP